MLERELAVPTTPFVSKSSMKFQLKITIPTIKTFAIPKSLLLSGLYSLGSPVYRSIPSVRQEEIRD